MLGIVVHILKQMDLCEFQCILVQFPPEAYDFLQASLGHIREHMHGIIRHLLPAQVYKPHALLYIPDMILILPTQLFPIASIINSSDDNFKSPQQPFWLPGVCACECSACGDQKRGPDPLDLELQVA
ncbi:hypothetical protein STEG23_031745 [Scotinomys teguina]